MMMLLLFGWSPVCYLHARNVEFISFHAYMLWRGSCEFACMCVCSIVVLPGETASLLFAGQRLAAFPSTVFNAI